MDIIKKTNLLPNAVIMALILILSYFIFHVAMAGLVSSFSIRLSSQVISSAANHTINFNIASNFSPGETMELYFEPDFDLSRITYADIDFMDDGVDLNLGSSAGSGAGSDIGVDISGQTIVFQQNDTDTVWAGSRVTIAIGLNADHQVQGQQQIYNPSVAGTYNISLGGDFGDLGVLAVQILSSDAVYLEAEILPEISFFLRNNDDTSSFQNCNLGSINHLGISQCSYRLAVQTNAARGFKVYVRSDGDFRNEHGFISNVAQNSQVVQGVEGYGIAVEAGTGILKQGDFLYDDTSLSTNDQLLIKVDSVYNYKEGNLLTSTLITHKVSVSPQTKAGAYSQQILYTILANY